MKIGVWDRSTNGWASGSEYTRAQVATLLAVQDELGLDVRVIADTDASSMRIAGTSVPITRMPDPPAGSLPTRELDRVLLRTGVAPTSQLRRWRAWVAAEKFDVIVSFIPQGHWWQPSDVATCAWLWDFQHRALPEMFPRAQWLSVDAWFRHSAEVCDLVVVSSEASERDYQEFAPDLADKARIYRFPSRFAFDPALASPDADLDTVFEKYHIDRDFFLVVNQFWQHKNHEAVVEAAGILQRTTGRCPQIVMIGLPFDDRDRNGRYMSTLLGKIAEYGLEGRVKILGFVSGAERDALFRCCKALLQPSRFEGWNTSIEDAKAIGRPVIASGLDVNREQLPEAFGFFDLDDAAGLADLIARADSLPAGPDAEREAAALATARSQLVEIGRQLHAICEEAAARATARGATLPMGRPVQV